MGEADWWLCTSCSSLNNLAASTCYSCGQGKPKRAVRASEYLGYRPIVSWDGKIKLEQLTAEERGTEGTAAVVGPRGQDRPPLREPIPRSTLAVAPRPPYPARITYRLDAPLSPPGSFVAPAPNPVAGPPPPPGPPGPGTVPGRPLVAVGPGPGSAPGPPGDPWPHWRELLDGPAPQTDQLRSATSDNAGVRAQLGASSRAEGQTLGSAMRRARTGDARESIPWPEEDRRRPEGDTAGKPEPAWPSRDVPPE